MRVDTVTVRGELARHPSASFLVAPGLGGRVSHGFGLRGVTAARLAECLGSAVARVIEVRQVHGDTILKMGDLPGSDGAAAADGDALMTDRPGWLLAVRTADCVPILIHDPVRRVVAAVHAGWRGTLKQITSKTIAATTAAYGVCPDDLRVAIGPSARRCCYEVDETVLAPLRRLRSDHAAFTSARAADRALLDLAGLNARQVADAGVPAAQIAVLDACTICRTEFGSYRREGPGMQSMARGIMLVP